MKRNRFSSRKRISADATELIRLAIGLAEVRSQLEYRFEQNCLAELVALHLSTLSRPWSAASELHPSSAEATADLSTAMPPLDFHHWI